MTQSDTRVLYNHDCPICRAEITHYADYAGREGLAIGFDDLNRVDLGMWGVTADQAARRLHVVLAPLLYRTHLRRIRHSG